MKANIDLKLVRRQVNQKLHELELFKKQTKGVSSWSKYLRSALGMSLSQYAERMKTSVSTASEAEKHEAEGKITINKLKKMAEALDCELVYAFVPKTSIEETILIQAQKKVLASMDKAETHMEFEDQKVLRSKDERLKELVEEKMYSKYLWEQD